LRRDLVHHSTGCGPFPVTREELMARPKPSTPLIRGTWWQW
jgi:hypothetical protein